MYRSPQNLQGKEKMTNNKKRCVKYQRLLYFFNLNTTSLLPIVAIQRYLPPLAEK